MNTQVFQHTFKNGQKVLLTVDLSGTLPRFVASPSNFLDNVDISTMQEYRSWLEGVIVPTISEALTTQQRIECALVALHKIVSKGHS
jgi:hypothetical protein